jgi:hypothetical protein
MIFRALLRLLFLSLLAGDVFGQPFPLSVSANGRYFVDAAGKPFFYHADTPWFICHQLTLGEAREYLRHARGLGFTAVQVHFSNSPADVNRAGQRPFRDPNDFMTVNEAYFDHVARVLTLADSLGLLVCAAPLWKDCCGTGYGGTPDKPYQRNGPQKARWFGQYLGKKFGKFQNLCYIMGGDSDPVGDREVIEQMALGLREFAPHQLVTYHAGTTKSSTDLFQYAPWLGFSMVYTYYRPIARDIGVPSEQVPQVYEVCLREYRKSDRMPFVLGEAQYEDDEDPDYGSPQVLRRQAYWALTSGAAGHAVGTSMWNFGENWRKKLALPGLTSMKHLARLLAEIPWHTLQPDQTHRVAGLVVGNYGEDTYVTTAVSEDRTLSISYFPVKKTVVFDPSSLKGRLFYRWMNAATGEFTPPTAVNPQRPRNFAPPAVGDWVLLISSRGNLANLKSSIEEEEEKEKPE